VHGAPIGVGRLVGSLHEQLELARVQGERAARGAEQGQEAGRQEVARLRDELRRRHECVQGVVRQLQLQLQRAGDSAAKAVPPPPPTTRPAKEWSASAAQLQHLVGEALQRQAQQLAAAEAAAARAEAAEAAVDEMRSAAQGQVEREREAAQGELRRLAEQSASQLAAMEARLTDHEQGVVTQQAAVRTMPAPRRFTRPNSLTGCWWLAAGAGSRDGGSLRGAVARGEADARAAEQSHCQERGAPLPPVASVGRARCRALMTTRSLCAGGGADAVPGDGLRAASPGAAAAADDGA
jgi:hypothetical protein